MEVRVPIPSPSTNRARNPTQARRRSGPVANKEPQVVAPRAQFFQREENVRPQLIKGANLRNLASVRGRRHASAIGIIEGGGVHDQPDLAPADPRRGSLFCKSPPLLAGQAFTRQLLLPVRSGVDMATCDLTGTSAIHEAAVRLLKAGDVHGLERWPS
jgi:hypothetical protein